MGEEKKYNLDLSYTQYRGGFARASDLEVQANLDLLDSQVVGVMSGDLSPDSISTLGRFHFWYHAGKGEGQGKILIAIPEGDKRLVTMEDLYDPKDPNSEVLRDTFLVAGTWLKGATDYKIQRNEYFGRFQGLTESNLGMFNLADRRLELTRSLFNMKNGFNYSVT